MNKSTNIVWHETAVTRRERHLHKGHKSCVIWFTGLSGSGKSTLANALDLHLFHQNFHSFVLDGDNIRHGLNRDLRFGKEDRKENIRRIGEVAKLFVDSGQIICTAFISPFREDRNLVREMFAEGDFIEVYVHCPIQVCESRDPKGLYKKARNGEIPEFTGISSPYEAPVEPEISLDTSSMSIEDCVKTILSYLKKQKIL